MTAPSFLAGLPAETFDRASLWHYRAQPLRVIDGDTFVALVDTGFNGRHEAHIRIEGLNAPELREPGGHLARVRLVNAFPWGDAMWSLRIVSRQRETVVAETRSFERFVATVYVAQPDGSLADVRDLLAG